jgi:hypothetical protein
MEFYGRRRSHDGEAKTSVFTYASITLDWLEATVKTKRTLSKRWEMCMASHERDFQRHEKAYAIGWCIEVIKKGPADGG